MVDGLEELAFYNDLDSLSESPPEDNNVKDIPDNSYYPLQRETYHYLAEQEDILSTDTAPSDDIVHNNIISKMHYLYATGDTNAAINLALLCLEQSNKKGGKTLVNQFHGLLVQGYMKKGNFEEAQKYSIILTQSCGHQDSDCWITYALSSILCGDIMLGISEHVMVC